MVEFTETYQPERRGDQSKAGKGNKKRVMMSDALALALNEEADGILDKDGKPTKKLRVIADKLVSMAVEGDIQAIKEVADRTEGKARQALEVSGRDGGPLAATFVFNPVGPDNESN